MPVSMRRYAPIPLAALFLAAWPASAQTAVEPDVTISTDRSSVANSSIVVPQGGLQIENGFLVTHAAGQSSLDLPETSLRYGLLGKTELRVTVPNYFYNLPGDISGFGDLALGIKQQLGPLHGFDLSVVAFLSFPTGANEISSHGYDPGVQLPWSRSLSKKWVLGGQVAFYWPTVAGKRNFTGQTTVSFSRQLAKSWDAFVEYAGDFPERGGSRQLLHFGTAYKLAPHHQIDFHVAPGLSAAAPDWFVGFGYSYLFLPKRR